jgi:hypothetical protein
MSTSVSCCITSHITMVIINARFAGSIPTEVDGFLRVIKIRSTTSVGGEVKPSVPCRRFTACKRTLRAWIEMFRKQNSTAICHPSLLTAVTSGLSWTARPVGWSPNCHICADQVTSERGGPSPYRAVEPWLLLLLLYKNKVWKIILIKTLM